MQCHKRLYLELNAPELAGGATEANNATFEVGYKVGELARKRYSGGTLVDHDCLYRAEAEGALRRR